MSQSFLEVSTSALEAAVAFADLQIPDFVYQPEVASSGLVLSAASPTSLTAAAAPASSSPAAAPASAATPCAASAAAPATAVPQPKPHPQPQPKLSSLSMPASARLLLDAAPADRSRSPQRHRWDTSDVAILREEQALAAKTGVPWRERGPPGPAEGGPEVWRNQRHRAGSNRYANRGGKQRAYFAAKYGGKSSSSGYQGKGKGKGGGNVAGI